LASTRAAEAAGRPRVLGSPRHDRPSGDEGAADSVRAYKRLLHEKQELEATLADDVYIARALQQRREWVQQLAQAHAAAQAAQARQAALAAAVRSSLAQFVRHPRAAMR